MAAHNERGKNGERAVAELLRAMGYTVMEKGGRDHDDLIIDGPTRVDVKTAGPTKERRRWRFDWCLDRKGTLPMDQDIVILRAEPDSGEPYHYVIPGALLRGQRTIQAPINPDQYQNNPLRYFREAWALLEAAVALQKERARQGTNQYRLVGVD